MTLWKFGFLIYFLHFDEATNCECITIDIGYCNNPWTRCPCLRRPSYNIWFLCYDRVRHSVPMSIIFKLQLKTVKKTPNKWNTPNTHLTFKHLNIKRTKAHTYLQIIILTKWLLIFDIHVYCVCIIIQQFNNEKGLTFWRMMSSKMNSIEY